MISNYSVASVYGVNKLEVISLLSAFVGGLLIVRTKCVLCVPGCCEAGPWHLTGWMTLHVTGPPTISGLGYTDGGRDASTC